MENRFARRPWLVPLLLAVLTVLFLRPLIFSPQPGDVLNGKDMGDMFYPLQHYTRNMVLDGEWPLWNPHQFIGTPHIGNPHVALFYPATWFLWITSVERGIGLMLALHTWIGAWGAARLMRSFQASYTGSLLAGVIVAMSGWASAHYYPGHYNLLMVYAWLPWVMVAYRHALARGTWEALLPGIGVMGAAWLAGYTPLMVYAGIGLVSLWLYHAAQDDDPVRAGWWAGWRLAVIIFGGLILGATVILPAAELTQVATREASDLTFANEHAMPPAQLLTMIVPDLYGEPYQEPYFYWGADFYEEFNAYVGLLPLLAVPLALRRARRETWYFVGLIVFGVAFSLGLEGAVMPLIVRWIPGFAYFRVPARALLLAVIGLAGLAAQVITHLQTASLDERRDLLAPTLRLWLPVGITLALTLSIFFSGWYASASHVEPMPQRAAVVAAGLAKAALIAVGLWLALWLWTRPEPQAPRWAYGLTALLVVLDAWHVGFPIITVGQVPEIASIWQGAQVNISTDDPARLMQPLPYGGPTNGASVSGHYSVQGYHPLMIETFEKLQALGAPDDPENRANVLMGVTYLLAVEPVDLPDFELIGINYGANYYRRTDPFPRAWVAADIVHEPNDDLVRQQIMTPEVNLLETVFVDEAVSCPGDGGTASISEYRPNDVSIQTEGGGGLLVLSDQYYPGWQAEVDGKHAEIVRTDTAFRGVCVPSGAHTVTFKYRPMSFYAGTVISAVGWVAWLLLTIGAVMIRRRRAASLPSG